MFTHLAMIGTKWQCYIRIKFSSVQVSPIYPSPLKSGTSRPRDKSALGQIALGQVVLLLSPTLRRPRMAVYNLGKRFYIRFRKAGSSGTGTGSRNEMEQVVFSSQSRYYICLVLRSRESIEYKLTKSRSTGSWLMSDYLVDNCMP